MFEPKLILSETQLVDACKKGHQSAQRRLYEIYSARMFAVCLKYARTREAARDYLQDGFVAVYSKIDTYTGNGSFEGWMRKIFVNVALMDLRKNDVLRDAKDVTDLRADAPFVDDVLSRIASRDVLRLVEQMPIRYKVVFSLNVFEEMSHQEIAEALGITEAASRTILRRGRFWLQEEIKKMNGE